MKNTLFIGRLSWGLKGEDLVEFFSEHADVTSAKVITDRETGRSKGFGFIEFATEEDAAKIKEEFNGSEIDGRSVFIDFAQEKDQ